MNGISAITASVVSNIKWLMLVSLFSILAACGDDGGSDPDTQAPVITINGESTLNLTLGDIYNELGATAVDNVDGTVAVTISGNVATHVIGIYIITYTASDSEGNSTSITRTINVLEPDLTSPTITLIGGNPYSQNEDIPYQEPGYTVTDNRSDPVAVKIDGSIDTSTPGTYTLTYTATDRSGNTSSVSRTVIILDATKPEITINGSNPHVQDEGVIYNDAGALAVDSIDGNVMVNTSSNVDHTIPGSYLVTYTAEDSSGNIATATRTVVISDITPPVITLIGEAEIDIAYGSTFDDPSASAIDNVDSSISITTSGSVDTSAIGQYKIVYTAMDRAGNSASVTRIIHVKDLTAPVISLNGSPEVTVVFGRDSYIEAGATALDDLDGVIEVIVNGEVDDTTEGTYIISYSATDAAGNSNTVTRTVLVWDPFPFITTWKTDNEGISEDNQISIQTTTNNQNYTIDWGDGTTDTNVTGDITHTYASPGVYTVKISGDFKNIRFNYDFFEHLSDNLKLLSIEQWGRTQWSTMESAFYHCRNMVSNATDIPDLNAVTNMSKMFYQAQAFNSDLSQWNVSSVTNMSEMFQWATAFDSDISQWDVSSVTNMSGMFAYTGSFNSDISQWDVSSVTNMQNIFGGARSFNSDLSQWDVSSVTNMAGTFSSADSFNNDISQWDVSSVTNMRGMFFGSDSFNGDISQWDVSSVTDMHSMFYGSISFNSDISQWDVSSVINMFRMFANAESFNGDISQWDVSSVTDMSGMFRNTAFDGDISQWNVSSVTDMSGMFYDATFNGDISQWDVSSVTNMRSMFAYTSAFNGDISQWNVSSVTDMGWMFYKAYAFNKDLTQWNVSGVTDMSRMFYKATEFNGDISQWKTSAVTNMREMFFGATSFNSDISQWDVTAITDMSLMFNGATSFNSDLTHWDVSSMTSLSKLFYGATAFNGDISQWDVSSVYSMKGMFEGASSFNSDISQWDVSSVLDMSNMFSGAVNFNNDISQWDVSSATNMERMFSDADNFNSDISQWDVSSVKNVQFMFNSADSFNGNISQWDMSSVRYIRGMFNDALTFNSDISLWNLSSVTNMDYLFSGASIFNGDISQWDVSSVTSMKKIFKGATKFNGDITEWNVSSVYSMQGMFEDVTLPTEKYDALLNSWIEKRLRRGILFHGGNSQYSEASRLARQRLTSNYGWMITDGGLVTPE